MAKVKHKTNEDYRGEVVGVQFEDGVAETEDGAALGFFQRHADLFEVEEKPQRRQRKPKAEKPEDGEAAEQQSEQD